MSKAENFTVRMGEDLKHRMKAHPEMNWSHLIREYVESMLDDIERMDRLAAGSQLTDENIDELAAMIDAAGAERAREDIETVDSETDAPHGEMEKDETSQRRDLTDVDAA